MRKTNILLLGTSLLITHQLNAATTTCVKTDWTKPSTIETVALNQGECKGEFSLKQMKAKGWFVQDINIKKGQKGFNYTYILTDKNPVELSKEANARNIKNKNAVKFKSSDILLQEVSGNQAVINIGNLKEGQSGVIQHKYENGKSLIVSSAYVVSSNETQSTVKFIPFSGLVQNAIPTSSRKPQNGDRFILNYLYNESLLITPNVEAFRAVRKQYIKNNFPHSDIYASYLKTNYEPTPNKREIQEYALSQDLGTIFFVIDSYVYIVDSRTMGILAKKPLSYVPGNEQMPFYTRIQKIETSILKGEWLDWFSFKFVKKLLGDDERSEDEILYGDLADDENKTGKISYTAYYKRLLGIKID